MFSAPEKTNAHHRLSGVQTKLHLPWGTRTMYFIIPLLERERKCTHRTFLTDTPTVPLFLTPAAWPDRTTISIWARIHSEKEY